MTKLERLETRLKATFPNAEIYRSEPVASDGVGFLDISQEGFDLAIQWQKDWGFGVSSPDGHGYGQRPDEVIPTLEETELRVMDLIRSRTRTQPPQEVTLRELRTERELAQSDLGKLLGISQPAVSKLERKVSRMQVATLQEVLRAMGGKLVLQAHFPGGVIHQLALDEDKESKAGTERGLS